MLTFYRYTYIGCASAYAHTIYVYTYIYIRTYIDTYMLYILYIYKLCLRPSTAV